MSKEKGRGDFGAEVAKAFFASRLQEVCASDRLKKEVDEAIEWLKKCPYRQDSEDFEPVEKAVCALRLQTRQYFCDYLILAHAMVDEDSKKAYLNKIKRNYRNGYDNSFQLLCLSQEINPLIFKKRQGANNNG